MRQLGKQMSLMMKLMVTALLLNAVAYAQSEKLAGKWEGTMKAPQGERAATAVFKKEGEIYTGTITGLRGDVPLKDIKVAGDKITAKAEIETPQATLTINYEFVLQGDGLKGTGSLDFGGSPISFDLDMKRAAEGAAASTAAAPAAPRTPRAPSVEQPQQKQSIDYFVGAWNFRYLGRESGLGPAPREGVLTLSKAADGKTLNGSITGKHEGGAYQETVTVAYDEATKALTFLEKRPGNVTLKSQGDWTSPIAIRFKVDPVKAKDQTLQLRRTISVVAAHSFTVTEELSEDGGPFVRLGNAVYSKVEAK
jgi:hypothetical protein